MSTTTPNLNLILPDFNLSPWHDEINANFRNIDATIKSVFGIDSLLGEYQNSTAVTTGQRYFDTSTGFYYEAQSDFTTLAAPNTFADERTAHPTRWEVLDAAEAINAAANALASANAAAASAVTASDAVTDAETAQGLAETAQAAAEVAQGLAETAQSYAETAQTAAELAETNAEAAQIATQNLLSSLVFPTQQNAIIDGRFNYWLEGTSQTSSGYGSDTLWFNSHSGSTKTHTRESFVVGQIDVPGNPKYFSRTNVTSVAGIANYVVKQFFIEDVSTFAGEEILLNFYAKADAVKNIAIEFYQNFGTGGSSAVSGIEAQKIALTASWQNTQLQLNIPSISGKTVGSANDDFLGLIFWFDAGSNYNVRSDSLGQQSGIFDIAEVSARSLDFEYDFRDRRLERYYEQSWDDTLLTLNGSLSSRIDVAAAGTSSARFGMSPTLHLKRSVPTVTIYSPDTGTAGNLYNVITDTDVPGTVSSIGLKGWASIAGITPAQDANDTLYCHWKADARL
jgi:hypothetical protein